MLKNILIKALLFFCGLLFITQLNNCEPQELKVYIEDSHSGHFYYLAEELDFSLSYHLINFDAHPDNDYLRDYFDIRLLLKDNSDKRKLLERLREDGAVQCYNWIHGLTPNPISSITWVPQMNFFNDLYYEINHFMVVTEEWLSTGNAYVVDFDFLDSKLYADKKIIVSIDLDFFCQSIEPIQDIKSVLEFVLELDNLEIITIAISRPYLPSDSFTFKVLYEVLRELFDSSAIGSIYFEPFLKQVNDTSRKASFFKAYGKEVPYFDIIKAPHNFKILLIENRHRILVKQNTKEWEDFLIFINNN